MASMQKSFIGLKDSIIELAKKHLPLSDENVAAESPFSLALEEMLRREGYRDEDAELRNVTILLSDLRGFTAISERYSATVVLRLLNRYLSRMSEIIYSHGGLIDKYMGDAILALFGVPDERPDDLQRAIGCAIEMQCAMDDINNNNLAAGLPKIYMGIGINTGEVATGNVGSNIHSEFTVIGDEVNLASRIEAFTLRGQVLISEKSFRLAREFIETRDAKDVHVKGKSELVRLHEVAATNRPERMELPMREIRTGHRIKATLPLRFQLLDGKTVLQERHDGKVIDISYNGIMAQVPLELPTFSEIMISLTLSLMGDEISNIYGKILRCKKVKTGYECSIEFTSVDDKAQEAINQFVDWMIAG